MRMTLRTHRAFTRYLGLGLLASCTAACGDDTGGTGAGGAGTSAPASGAGGDAADACKDLPVDGASAGPVEIRIRNGRADPIYIGGSANACANVPPGATEPMDYFELTNAAGESIAVAAHSEAFFCSSLREAACGCEAVGCVKPAALKIAPGAT